MRQLAVADTSDTWDQSTTSHREEMWSACHGCADHTCTTGTGSFSDVPYGVPFYSFPAHALCERAVLLIEKQS